MFLAEPPPSTADLHFRIFGFPVRVHPYFWVVVLLLGIASGDREPRFALTWVAVAFVSVLVHELGHAVLQRRYGGEPRIVLYSLGGLAICEDCDRSPGKQIAISLAGPLAGFALAAAVVVAIRMSGHPIGYTTDLTFPFDAYLVPAIVGKVYFAAFRSEALSLVVWTLLWVNIWWGVLNLLPIYPLDGGRVSREICTLRGNPRQGIVNSLWISIFTAAAVAIFSLFQGSLFLPIMLGMLGYSNYQTLQTYRSYDEGRRW